MIALAWGNRGPAAEGLPMSKMSVPGPVEPGMKIGDWAYTVSKPSVRKESTVTYTRVQTVATPATSGADITSVAISFARIVREGKPSFGGLGIEVYSKGKYLPADCFEAMVGDAFAQGRHVRCTG